MIFIEKESTNQVVLTLSESSMLTTPTYLFEFENSYNISADLIYFTAPDISSHPERYNLFQITESSSGSTTGGTNVSLSLIGGEYTYRVYESSASTLSVSATTGVVIEEGKMVVGDYVANIINNITPSVYD